MICPSCNSKLTFHELLYQRVHAKWRHGFINSLDESGVTIASMTQTKRKWSQFWWSLGILLNSESSKNLAKWGILYNLITHCIRHIEYCMHGAGMCPWNGSFYQHNPGQNLYIPECNEFEKKKKATLIGWIFWHLPGAPVYCKWIKTQA